MSDDVACQWCGGDSYFEWELKDGKCKTCEVEDCNHPASHRDRNYMGSNHHRARFEETCIMCGCFREVRITWKSSLVHRTKWDHDDVRQDDIPQEDRA